MTDDTSELHQIKSGVPQGSVLGPVLYLTRIYTSDLPTTNNILTSTFADDIAILEVHKDPIIASTNLQNHLNLPEMWLKRCQIKINETKSQNSPYGNNNAHQSISTI